MCLKLTSPFQILAFTNFFEKRKSRARGDSVRDNTGNQAVFTEQPASVSAAGVLETPSVDRPRCLGLRASRDAPRMLPG